MIHKILLIGAGLYTFVVPRMIPDQVRERDDERRKEKLKLDIKINCGIIFPFIYELGGRRLDKNNSH